MNSSELVPSVHKRVIHRSVINYSKTGSYPCWCLEEKHGFLCRFDVFRLSLFTYECVNNNSSTDL